MVAPPALIAWLSLAEWKVIARLQYVEGPSLEFVVESVRGVLAGTPVSKSWAHRIVAPALVAQLGGPDARSVELFAGLCLLATNLLLFFLLRRRGVSILGAAAAVATFGLARFVLAYKLEYPWDGVDALVFVAFGAIAAGGYGLAAAGPLLMLGTFNHETILYVPIWYLLAEGRSRRLAAAAVATAMVAVVALTRRARYVGQPVLEGQVFEAPTPVIENHLHVAHNLRELFVRDWTSGRAHISLGFLAATSVLAWLTRREATRVPAVWSLVVLGTVVAFGYVNETRHYVLLAAFWTAYAWSRHGVRGDAEVTSDQAGRSGRSRS